MYFQDKYIHNSAVSPIKFKTNIDYVIIQLYNYDIIKSLQEGISMKKLLVILLVVTMLFTVMLASACNNNSGQVDDSVEETSSIYEQSSSTRVRPSQFGSGSIDTDPPTSNTGSDNPPTSGTKPNPPTSAGYMYGSYDYEYSTSVVEVNDYSTNAKILDSLLYVFISDYKQPTLNGNFYATLVDYENQYNALSATEKATVSNANILIEAREAYNNIAKLECEKLINELPDATSDNLIQFGAQAKAIQKLIDNLGIEANNIPNKAAYDQKVTKANSMQIDTFNKKVTELRTFEYTTAYKAKLDEVLDFYNNNLTAAQKSAVVSSYNELKSLITRYDDTGVINEFKEVYNKLPNASAVVKADKTNIELANTMFNKMTETQIQLLGDVTTISANLKSLKDAILAICPEYVWARTLASNKGLKLIPFANTSIVYDMSSLSTGSGSPGFEIEGKPLTQALTLNAGGTFSVKGLPYGGKLTLYIADYSDKGNAVSITVSGGSYTETINVTTGQPTEFNLPAGGDYTVSVSAKAKLYGIIFS